MTLDYSQPESSGWWRRHRRSLAVMISITVAVFVARPLAVRAWDRLMMLHMQQRALAYAPPSGQCALQITATKIPHPVFKETQTQERYMLPPSAWQAFMAAAGIDCRQPLFVGRRTSSLGHDRIIALSKAGIFSSTIKFSGPSETFGFVARVLGPATATTPATEVSTVPSSCGVAVDESTTYQIYVGTADPADKSRFTIVIGTGKQRCTVDGFLQNDDTVRFQIRDGHAVCGPIRFWR